MENVCIIPGESHTIQTAIVVFIHWGHTSINHEQKQVYFFLIL